ncbi:OprO/OprP family phosphate-selective porin [Marinobacter sediminicola]|uniref:OprO/OprP family phosphate-selective porin n=1 Tax=Marinobacter sediminicola TaxID=3072994 RepID=UPI0028123B41|nr:porin [Marinobacter sp. F26243]
MLADLRRTWLIAGLTLVVLLPPPTLRADPLELDLGGYIAAGVDRFGPFYNEEGDPDTTRGIVRNAKLELEMEWGSNWAAEIDGSYKARGDREETELGDAYVQYQGANGFEATLGRFKEPFGLERLTGYTNISTSERSMVTSAFAPGRSQGLAIGQLNKANTWVFGVFTKEPEGEQTHSVTGRYTVAPVQNNRRTLHFGIAASWRDLNGARFQVKDRGEVFSADNILRSPRFDARHTAVGGLEAAWSSGRLTVVSEAMAQQVERENGERWRFSGAYLQAGFFLTNDHRRYKYGEFKGPDSPGPAGAVELVARYSAVDLQDRDLGARAAIALVGANYYLGNQFQLRLNWLVPKVEGTILAPDPTGNAFTLRVLFRY